MKNCSSRRSFLKAAGILGAAGAPVSYTHLMLAPWMSAGQVRMVTGAFSAT